jgi:hypothetical protein
MKIKLIPLALNELLGRAFDVSNQSAIRFFSALLLCIHLY